MSKWKYTQEDHLIWISISFVCSWNRFASIIQNRMGVNLIYFFKIRASVELIFDYSTYLLREKA